MGGICFSTSDFYQAVFVCVLFFVFKRVMYNEGTAKMRHEFAKVTAHSCR